MAASLKLGQEGKDTMDRQKALEAAPPRDRHLQHALPTQTVQRRPDRRGGGRGVAGGSMRIVHGGTARASVV